MASSYSFKVEVVTDLPDVIYFERVDALPEERGKGYALRCISQLTAMFLERTRPVVLPVNEKNKAARRFYEKTGYELIGYYDAMSLQQQIH